MRYTNCILLGLLALTTGCSERSWQEPRPDEELERKRGSMENERSVSRSSDESSPHQPDEREHVAGID